MVRLVYTVSLLVGASLLFGCTTESKPVHIQDLATRLDRDSARERIQAKIMRVPPIVRYDPDVALIKKIAKNQIAQTPAYYVNPPHMPTARLFTGKEIALEDAITLLSHTLGYTPSFDKHVDVTMKVVLPSTPQSMNDLTETLAYQTQTRILVLPESRLIMVTEKRIIR